MYHLNFLANLKIKLKIIVWWFDLCNEDYDDDGWGRMDSGEKKHTVGTKCDDCHYYYETWWGGKGKGVWGKKYACKGLAKDAKWLRASSLGFKSSNKGSPPTSYTGGCKFDDWCDAWGDHDGQRLLPPRRSLPVRRPRRPLNAGNQVSITFRV